MIINKEQYIIAKNSLVHAIQLEEKIKQLQAQLFNSEQHYEVLKKNYDDAFEFFGIISGRPVADLFNEFLKWSGEKDECV